MKLIIEIIIFFNSNLINFKNISKLIDNCKYIYIYNYILYYILFNNY